MHAFLFINPQRKDIENKIQELGSKAMEFVLQKIDDVREINNFTKLKLGQKTTILIRDFDKATNEAQNSFLKSLEEPQENLSFLLTAQNKENVLETITSRCEVIELIGSKRVLSDDDKQSVEEFWNADTGNRLIKISKINKRDEAIVFSENLIILGHELMNTEPNKNWGIVEEALKLKTSLEANGNIQLQLTNFVVNN